MGSGGMGANKISVVKYQKWSQTLYYTIINNVVITILEYTSSWGSEEMDFLES